MKCINYRLTIAAKTNNMKTKSYTIKSFINPDIKKGDKVYIIDGSALTTDKSEKDHYIVTAYPEITGQNKKLKEIEATVITTGINNKACSAVENIIYLQDLEIQVGNAVFRTSSGMVTKVGAEKAEARIKELETALNIVKELIGNNTSVLIQTGDVWLKINRVLNAAK